jgi:hypothetical protein
VSSAQASTPPSFERKSPVTEPEDLSSSCSLAVMLRELEEDACHLLSVPVVEDKVAEPVFEGAKGNAFWAHFSAIIYGRTPRPPQAREGEHHAVATSSQDPRAGPSPGAPVAHQLYAALTMANAGAGPLVAVLHSLAQYLEREQDVGASRTLAALRVARCLLVRSRECREEILSRSRRSDPTPAPAAEGEGGPVSGPQAPSTFRSRLQLPAGVELPADEVWGGRGSGGARGLDLQSEAMQVVASQAGPAIVEVDVCQSLIKLLLEKRHDPQVVTKNVK